MSEQQPPPGAPEYLESGGGSPIPPLSEPPAGASTARRSRRVWWIGGGVVLLLGAGAGAWAAMGFFQQGAQPAEALPASTIGYLSIDLDPAGGQKIDAFRTLNKFPAFKDDVGVNSVDDIRRKVGESMLEDTGCTGLTYDDDIDPWLGERAAAAAVDLGDNKPGYVVVVQVKDEGEARDAFTALNKCDTVEDPAGFVVRDGWAVLAPSQEVADDVVAATDKATLADDATYQKWTKALGEPGVVNAYLSPDAGTFLAKQLSGFFGPHVSEELPFSSPDDSQGFSSDEPGSAPSASAQSSAFHAVSASDPLTDSLTGFKGGAATLRFTGDGLEFAAVGDGSSPQLADVSGNTGGTLVQRLPDDTGAAVGVTFPQGWLGRRLDQMSDIFGTGTSKDDAMRELSRETGLDLPADAETLLGSGVTISIGKNFDFEAAENTDDGTGLPVAATVKGDPAAIEQVLDKIRAKVGDAPFLGSDSAGDLEAVGPSQDYRRHVLAGGHLGDDDTFRSVVPAAGDASSVFYVSIDAFEPSITRLAAGDQETVDNVTPLKAIGWSAWKDADMARFSFKVTTN